jgi:predicted RNase H-like nuclease (RuvC/YqgF family)
MSTPITLEDFAKENETLVAQLAEQKAAVENLTATFETARDQLAKAETLNAAADTKIVNLTAELEKTKADVEGQIARRLAEHGVSKKAVETASDQKPETLTRDEQFAHYTKLLGEDPVSAAQYKAEHGKNFLRVR